MNTGTKNKIIQGGSKYYRLLGFGVMQFKVWYCPLLKRVHWTRRAWVKSLNKRDDGYGENI